MIREQDKHYYDEHKALIPDWEYDKLVQLLESIEKTHPEWVLKNSPSQGVGKERPSKGFIQVIHAAPMLSLSNTYSKEEVADFVKRVHKLIGKTSLEFSVELKIDGVAISLRYERGNLVRAVTRGDGKKGDDVTANVMTIPTIPRQLQGRNTPDVLEVRGEIYIPLKDFKKMNVNKKWANPRNMAAGSLKLLDTSEFSKRNLSIVLYGIAEDTLGSISTQGAVHKYLKSKGLPVANEKHYTVCSSVDEIFAFANKIEQQRSSLPFEIDGVVIKVNELNYHSRLGSTGKRPRWATSYKFTAEKVETRIESITVQVGRTGVLTPVAELTPVFLAGSMISRATLHNEVEVQRKDIRVGDRVVIEKGGDVIPKIVGVVLKSREFRLKSWKMPNKCPVCGTSVERVEGEVAVRCPNKSECGGQAYRRFSFFASKGAMDIDDLGSKIVAKLIDQGKLQKLSDIYRLRVEDLEQLEGFKEKSIGNLLESIEKSKTPTLARFIFALGIPHIGIETAELLANHYETMEKVKQATFDELVEIEGIGKKIAQSIELYFDNEIHIQEIDGFFELGVKPQEITKNRRIEHAFSGKVFVLTGGFDEFTRIEASMLIKKRGGKVSSSVSSKTDYLLVGNDPGSKYVKAKKLGIAILDEESFKRTI